MLKSKSVEKLVLHNKFAEKPGVRIDGKTTETIF